MRISDWSSDVCSSDLLESLRSQDLEVHVLFLRADDSILLQRYSETRRRHPLAQGDIGLSEAIRIERQLLAPIANAADATIDTSRTNLHPLSAEMQGLGDMKRVVEGPGVSVRVTRGVRQINKKKKEQN